MKTIPVICLIASLVGGELELGSEIPMADTKMLDVSGVELSLNDIKMENGLLVIFSSNTCPWVIRWQDRYVEIAGVYKEKGVGVVAINSNEAYRAKGDSFSAMKEHALNNGYNFYYTVDENSELATVFGATRTPHIYLFDKEYKLVYRGAIDDNARSADKVESPYLKNALDAMLAGEKIKEPSTKALGCSIKF